MRLWRYLCDYEGIKLKLLKLNYVLAMIILFKNKRILRNKKSIKKIGRKFIRNCK